MLVDMSNSAIKVVTEKADLVITEQVDLLVPAIKNIVFTAELRGTGAASWVFSQEEAGQIGMCLVALSIAGVPKELELPYKFTVGQHLKWTY